MRRLVVIATGGTISASADADAVLRPTLSGADLTEGLDVDVIDAMSVDSSQLTPGDWDRIAAAVRSASVVYGADGVVVTHGTDTMEETALWLALTYAGDAPVVLTGAMRPATSLQSDGPQNLQDAVAVARTVGARGVLVAMAGTVHRGLDVRKVHPYRLDAFSSGDAGPLGRIEEGQLRQTRDWPAAEPLGLGRLPVDPSRWPRVAIVTSGAGSAAWMVEGLRSVGVRGIVVAATGNGTVNDALETALLAAQSAGVAVLRSTRCGDGRIVPGGRRSADAIPSAGALTPVQARIELLLRLMADASVAQQDKG